MTIVDKVLQDIRCTNDINVWCGALKDLCLLPILNELDNLSKKNIFDYFFYGFYESIIVALKNYINIHCIVKINSF